MYACFVRKRVCVCVCVYHKEGDGKMHAESLS